MPSFVLDIVKDGPGLQHPGLRRLELAALQSRLVDRLLNGRLLDLAKSVPRLQPASTSIAFARERGLRLAFGGLRHV